MNRDDQRVIEAYKKAVGRPPQNVHADDPDWRYRGTKTEREELKERVLGEEVPVIEGQETLFDA